MGEPFYERARLYDLMFPSSAAAAGFYRGVAAEQPGASVLELGCGTGNKLIPIAADGHPAVGLDSSRPMLDLARRKADDRGVQVEWVEGDMRDFDLGRTFDLVVIAANSLLHLHEAEEIIGCLRGVRRHLSPGGRLALDVFNPAAHVIAAADGQRRPRPSLAFTDPDLGPVSVEVAEAYDAAAQVTRGTWFLSTAAEPDLVVVPLEIRSIYPQELPLLLERAGLRLVERFGDWSRGAFISSSPLQLCICRPD